MKQRLNKNTSYISLTVFLLLSWTIIIGSITIFNIREEHKLAEERLLNQQRLSSILTKTAWSWVSYHGGVYVPFSEQFSPSQYLDDNKSVKITTTGDTLVIITPVEMSNQTYDLSRMENMFSTRIVSTHPLNADNTANEWETSGIQYFEEAVRNNSPEVNPYLFDYYEINDLYGENAEFKFLTPLIAEESCLTCHQYGAKEGEVLGAISTHVDNTPFLDWFRSDTSNLFSTSLIVWILGCFGIFIIMHNISRRIQKELTLKKFEGVLEMAGSAAHELNQPLQVISGYAELISMLDTKDHKTVNDMMNAIRDNILRLAVITRKLNGITRYETIELTSKDRIVDLNKAASDTSSISSK